MFPFLKKKIFSRISNCSYLRCTCVVCLYFPVGEKWGDFIGLEKGTLRNFMSWQLDTDSPLERSGHKNTVEIRLRPLKTRTTKDSLTWTSNYAISSCLFYFLALVTGLQGVPENIVEAFKKSYYVQWESIVNKCSFPLLYVIQFSYHLTMPMFEVIDLFLYEMHRT